MILRNPVETSSSIKWDYVSVWLSDKTFSKVYSIFLPYCSKTRWETNDNFEIPFKFRKPKFREQNHILVVSANSSFYSTLEIPKSPRRVELNISRLSFSLVNFWLFAFTSICTLIESSYTCVLYTSKDIIYKSNSLTSISGSTSADFATDSCFANYSSTGFGETDCRVDFHRFRGERLH